MKKLVLLSSFLLSLATMSYAQITFRYGAKGGFSRSDVSNNGDFSFSHYNGYTFGAFTEVSKTNLKNLFLRGGINISERGLVYAQETTSNRYLEIPIQIGYKVPTTSFLSIYALAGPSVHFRTYGNGYLKGTGSSDASKWNTQKVIPGVDAALGLEFFKHIQLEASYQYGFTPDYKSSSYKANNNTFLFTAGLAF